MQTANLKPPPWQQSLCVCHLALDVMLGLLHGLSVKSWRKPKAGTAVRMLQAKSCECVHLFACMCIIYISLYWFNIESLIRFPPKSSKKSSVLIMKNSDSPQSQKYPLCWMGWCEYLLRHESASEQITLTLGLINIRVRVKDEVWALKKHIHTVKKSSPSFLLSACAS